MTAALARTFRLALLLGAGASAACGRGEVTAPGGRAARVTKLEDTDNQIALAGTAVAHPPAVRVLDQKGNPVAGVSVAFVVTAGAGTVSATSETANGANTATVITDGTGLATLGGWTVGSLFGENKLTAAVGSGVSPVEFVAISAHPCQFSIPLALGASATGVLTTKDCDDGYYYYDFFRTQVVTGGAVLFSVSSTAFDAYAQMVDDAGNFIALNDNRGGPNAGIKALLRTAVYTVAASSSIEHRTGSYTVSAQTTNPSIERCEDTWASVGINTTQTLSSTDCSDVSRAFNWDRITIVLNKGQKATITMSSTDFDAYLTLAEVNGTLVGDDDNGNGATNARLVYTSPVTAAYFLDAGSRGPGQTGQYTLGIH